MHMENKTLQPVIVSASRSTDIPAFYSNWFMNRIKAGHCCWVNPFNQEAFRVSFEKTRLFVFWSKNPRPLISRLEELHAHGFENYYFQFTLNDYVKEGLEPNVPSVESRVETFRLLSSLIGKERVIWRFDPLLLSDSLTVDVLLARIAKIGMALSGCTEKLVFSFADIQAYRKVIRNLSGTNCREFSKEKKLEFVEGLRELKPKLGFEVATCAEDIDLSAFGCSHNKCIDDDLMVRVFSDDPLLMDFIGAKCDLIDGWKIAKSRKDKGQRKACGCVVSKDIGMYNTCPHLCRYCYANASNECVMKNVNRHNDESESIVGDLTC